MLIVEKQPLEKSMLTLEAEIGPVKYIAALAVDWGWTDKVETNEAVRWVILLLIVVFDPLAVLLLIAANQSLMRRFPPEPPKPQEVIDLEKPELDSVLQWSQPQSTANNKKIQEVEKQVHDWQDKLSVFNSKAPKPKTQPVEFITDHPKEEPVEFDEDRMDIVAQNGNDGLHYEEEKVKESQSHAQKEQQDLEKYVLEATKEAEKKKSKLASLELERKKLEDEKHTMTEDEITATYAIDYDEKPKPKEETTISEQIEEVMESERLRPDFTEVVETDTQDNKNTYEQNSEQKESGNWSKIQQKTEDPVEYRDAEGKLKTFSHTKVQLLSDEEYRQKMEDRINNLIEQIEKGTVQLRDLSLEDQDTITGIMKEQGQ
jgi:hypothetical protein